MTYRVIISPEAERDIVEVVEYFWNVDILTILDWKDRIRASILDLAYLPRRFGLADEADDVGRPIRVRLFGKRRGAWKIYYVIEGDEVHILRIRRGSRLPLSRRDLA